MEIYRVLEIVVCMFLSKVQVTFIRLVRLVICVASYSAHQQISQKASKYGRQRVIILERKLN